MTRSFVLRSAFAALLPIGFGCAAQSDGASKQVRDLNEQVRRIQSTSDRLEERVAALENARSRDAQRPAATISLPSDVPNLPVVKMTPDSTAPTSEAQIPAGDGDEPRPLIVGEGSRIETRSNGGESPAPNALPRRAKDKAAPDSAAAKRQNGTMDSGKKSQ